MMECNQQDRRIVAGGILNRIREYVCLSFRVEWRQVTKSSHATSWVQ
jgi:hypothetical protein